MIFLLWAIKTESLLYILKTELEIMYQKYNHLGE